MYRPSSLMLAAGTVMLVAALPQLRRRLAPVSGPAKFLVLGPSLEAVALTIFAAEHFLLAKELSGIVPHWLPGALFWALLVGVALLAAAISFVAWRYVRWSASLLALLFVIIVLTIDVPNLPAHMHERLFWTLTMRETAFAAGAALLAGSVWPTERSEGSVLIIAGRGLVTCTLIFYAFEHFLFPRNVPGVPLEMMTPGWIPAPVLLAWLTGAVLLAGGIGLLVPRTRRWAAAATGVYLALLTLGFYLPIFAREWNSPGAVEGANYIGDTLLFAATVLLAGYGSSTDGFA